MSRRVSLIMDRSLSSACRRESHMVKRLGLGVALAAVVLTMALAQGVWAQGDVWVQHSDPSWQANYWNNTSLSGTPVLKRQEAELNHDWGSGSPGSGVNADHFNIGAKNAAHRLEVKAGGKAGANDPRSQFWLCHDLDPPGSSAIRSLIHSLVPEVADMQKSSQPNGE